MKNTLALVALLAATASVALAQGGGGNSPTGVTPNYKPAGNSGGGKPAGKGISVRPGGQGHNSGGFAKGKGVVAPTTPPAHASKRTTSTTPASAP